jgi:SAM-dependent methyltransferase
MMDSSSSLERWLDTPIGTQLFELEDEIVQEALSDVFGFELLQIGRWGAPRELLKSARTQHARWLAPDACGHDAVRSLHHELPIANASVEGVLLPHTLEHAEHPHELLREVERVLTGEGHVVICGFNPFGPWGLRHRWARSGFPPQVVRMLSEHRLRDWLVLLGFEVISCREYLYTPPWQHGLSPRQRHWLERHGKRIAPLFNGAYAMKACKRVHGLTPIRPLTLRQRKPAVVGGLVEPTSRNGS